MAGQMQYNRDTLRDRYAGRGANMPIGSDLMRRRYFLPLLAGALLLALTACGKDDRQGEASPPQSDGPSVSQGTDQAPERTGNFSQIPDGPADTGAPADRPGTDDPADPPEETGTMAVPSQAQLGETEDMGQDYIDKITFLGDSTTYGLRYYKMLTGERDTTQVWTPSSGTLSLFQQSFALIVYPETGEEITILEAVERKKPEMMVITLGVNGVSMMDEDYFKSEYTSLVQGIQQTSPDTKIVLQSIFPVAASYGHLDSINNEKIGRANGWVLEVAEETGVHYLDTQTVLIGEDGWLPESYQNGDGLHLNETSFALVLDYIRTHGWQ